LKVFYTTLLLLAVHIWNKPRTRTIAVCSDRRFFGNKTLNAFEQSEGVKWRAQLLRTALHFPDRSTEVL